MTASLINFLKLTTLSCLFWLTGAIAEPSLAQTPSLFQPFDGGTTLQAVDSGWLNWADVNLDGQPDLLVTGWAGSAPQSILYVNGGAADFRPASANLPGVWHSHSVWADFDRDGDPDVILLGQDVAGEAITQLYQNERSLGFSRFQADLPGLKHGQAAWADFDGDGDPDLLLTGQTNQGTGLTQLFRNDSLGRQAKFVLESRAVFTPLAHSQVAWADFDRDGDPDVLLAGENQNRPLTLLYRNEGGGQFSLATQLPGVSRGGIAWGDYDRDGDPDVLLAGRAVGGGLTVQIQRNDGQRGFTQDGQSAFFALSEGAVAWLDYDGDGWLDILMSGQADNQTRYTVLYRGLGYGRFQYQPDVFPGLSDSHFAWADFDRDGDPDVVLSGWTGAEAVMHVYQNDHNRLRFVAVPEVLPGVEAGTAAWGDSDADGDLDLFLSGWNGSALSGRFYENLGGELVWRTDSPLEPSYLTAAEWGDFDNDGDPDLLFSGSTSQAPLTRLYRSEGGQLHRVADTGLPDVQNGAVAWGDYDHDGRLDVLLSGQMAGGERLTRLYQNQPGGGFSWFRWNEAVVLPGLDQSAAVWQDYDGDGDLDIALAGRIDNTRRLTQLYQQTDSGHFEPDSRLTAPGVSEGSLAWADFDQDGDPDLLLTGWNGRERLTQLYRNDLTQNDRFVLVTAAAADFSGVTYSEAKWGDYDNDGDPDVLLIGSTGGERIAEIHRNETPPGPATTANFVRLLDEQNQATALPGVVFGTADWVDIDQDGWLDVFLSGRRSASDLITELYRNVGAGARLAELPFATPEGVTQAGLRWGDYDQDGDLDLLQSGQTADGFKTQVWRNQGERGFWADFGASFATLWHGSAGWADFDGDGRWEIAISGEAESGTGTGSGSLLMPQTQVYQQNENGLFEASAEAQLVVGGAGSQVEWVDYNLDGLVDLAVLGADASGWALSLFPAQDGLRFGAAELRLPADGIEQMRWADFDRDGDPDVLLVGETSRLYRNQWPWDFFTETAPIFDDSLQAKTAEWVDFDSDGDVDISLSGTVLSGTARVGVTVLYAQGAALQFSPVVTWAGFAAETLAWGDFEGDGDPDLWLSAGEAATLYRNEWRTEGRFVLDVRGENIRAVGSGAAEWADFDGDGDVDLAIAGADGRQPISLIYENNPPNRPPSPPSGLTHTLTSAGVNLRWLPASDAETVQAALRYGVWVQRVGANGYSVPPLGCVMGEQCRPAGERQVQTGLGLGQTLSATVHYLPSGNYRWGVQAVDWGGAGAGWAAGEFRVLGWQGYLPLVLK